MATVLHDHVFKYIIIGDVLVGKSSVLFQFTDNTFMQECEPTVCVEFNSKIVQVNGKRIKLQIWDTSGQDRFRDVARTYYRGSACIFLMYDVARRSTFDHIKGWLQDAAGTASPGTVLVLLANKCELDALREVTTDEGQLLASHEGMLFFEVSAKTGQNIQDAFIEATKKVQDSVAEGILLTSPTLRTQNSPFTSDSLLDNPKNALVKTEDLLGSLEIAYGRLSRLSLFCVGTNHTPSRLSVKLCVLPWQIVGRALVFCIFMFLELAFILPCMFMVLVQRPRENGTNKPQSLNDSVDSLPFEPDPPISLPLFIVKSTLSLLFLLVYPLIAIYYLVPVYIFRRFPEEMVQAVVAIQVFVITVLLLFGIGRRLQKRKSAFDISRNDELKLGKLEGKFQWTNLGNWIVIGMLILEFIQVVGFPLQTLSNGTAKFFAGSFLYFEGASGTAAIFWMCIICVVFLFGMVNLQIMRDLRNYVSLRKQGKHDDASASFYFSFIGSVVFGHGKPENISRLVRYSVMICTDGLFFLLISQFMSIFACRYNVITAETHGYLAENRDIECWTPNHYTMAFFACLSLGYYSLFSGLVSPVIVEGGIFLDIYFHGVYTSAVNVVKFVFLFATVMYSPFTSTIYTLASCIAGILLVWVTLVWMLRTSTPMHQPSASAGANLFRAGTFASWGIAGLLAYVSVMAKLTHGVRIFILIPAFSVILAVVVIWHVRHAKKGVDYSEFSKMTNSEILIEEGSEMDSLGQL